MDFPAILSLKTQVPERCYSQNDIADFYIRMLGSRGKQRERALRSIMNYSGVSFRYSAVEPAYFEEHKSTQQRNDRYMEEALPLGERVIRDGLEQAGVTPAEISTFIVVSCTGFNIPGLDLLLAGRLGMRTDLSRTCVLAMGCYGAFPGIRRAVESVQAKPDGLALVLALELCTLHLQFDDAVETVVSTSLFADGAGMLLIGKNSAEALAPKIVDAETYCDYQTLDHMSFKVTDQGFRMYLSSYVPDVLAANVCALLERLLSRHGLQNENVKFWAIHPGSKKIVEYIQEQLQLTDDQVRHSLCTLCNYGNMSSATVLFVLESIMRTGSPERGDFGVMMAFGPGLTMEAMLVQW
ncbi:MAG: type III polyketide synthase [Chloroflexota bacterium]